MEADALETGVQHGSLHDPPILNRGTSRRKQHCPRKAPCESFVCIVPEQPSASLEQHVQRPTPPRSKSRKPAPCPPKEPKLELHGPCTHCSITYSPQWRRGPVDKPVLCNACGLRYGRTGSLDLAAPRRSSAASRPPRVPCSAARAPGAPLAAPGAAASAGAQGSACSSEEQEQKGLQLNPYKAAGGGPRAGSPDSATSCQAAMAPRHTAVGDNGACYPAYTNMLPGPLVGRGLRHKKPSQRLMEGLQVLLMEEGEVAEHASEAGDGGCWGAAQGGADQIDHVRADSTAHLPQQLVGLCMPGSAGQQGSYSLTSAGGGCLAAELAAGSGSWHQAEDAAWMLTVPGAIRKRPRNWVPLPPAPEEPSSSNTSGSSGYGPPLFKVAPATAPPVVGVQAGGSVNSQHYPILEVAPLHCNLDTAASLGAPLLGIGSCGTYLPTSSSCGPGVGSPASYGLPSAASSSWGDGGCISEDGSSQSSDGSTRMVKRCRTAGPSRLRASSS